jgi:ATP-dependent Zn protease
MEASAEHGVHRLQALAHPAVMDTSGTDVGATRERVRQRRLRRVAVVLVPIAVWLWVRIILGDAHLPGMPHVPSTLVPFIPAIALSLLLGLMLIGPLVGAGRSPHVLYRPSEIDVRLEDVRGAGTMVEEVVKTLNLFLAHRTFSERMGGSPRRAVLFEGPPGTGKTYMAKAMAAEAGVPFLFVSSSAFQSMFYGQTNRKIRSYFRALRAYARREGGAIGFIEEIDAIGTSRGGMSSGRGEGVAGVVNELLVQLQSFDQPTFGVRLAGRFVDAVNGWLPPARHLRKPRTRAANVLIIGATNRAADLDPALVRPGRFDRTITFDVPSRAGRRDIIDFYLDRKAHEEELDDPARRDALAALTFGHTPVMIEHLLDEALIWALRRGSDRLAWADLQKAKLTEEIGLAQDVEYAEAERRLIATHEAGHATVAWLVGKGRKLEVLSIVKRKNALGLLLHTDEEERFTRTRTEVEALVDIALGGMAAEQIFFGETSTGASSDLQAATNIVCHMVGAYGMGSSLVSSMAIETPGHASLVAKVLGTDAGREEVDKILSAAKRRAVSMLDEHLYVIEALRDGLLERDELSGDEIADVIAAARGRVPVA